MTHLDDLLLAASHGDWTGKSDLLRANLATWAGGRLKLTSKGRRRIVELKSR